MFTGHEDHNISLEDAAKMTKRFRLSLAPLLGGIIGGYFSKDAIQSVLNQDSVVGIRIYNALTADLIPLPQFVIVGVNAAGVDITAGVIIEHSNLCPPTCGPGNLLNS